MNLNKFTSSFLIMLLCLLQGACSDMDALRTNMHGTWVGGSPDTDFYWCITYKEDNTLTLITRQELIFLRENVRVDEVQISHFEGEWSLREGKRLQHKTRITEKWRNNKDMLEGKAKPKDLKNADYIVASADDDKMRYRWLALVEGEEHWFESNRADSCPKKFDSLQ